MKEAGIRTHFVVAVGASLMMVISKYGFQDQVGWDVALDPSRIAAQVVSGVGFLGAGMIFMQRHTVKGLTTAAGIWATAGIGMAIGCGLYEVGGAVTLFLLAAQFLMHGRLFRRFSSPKTVQLQMRVLDVPGAIDEIRQALQLKNVIIFGFNADHKNESELELELTLRLNQTRADALLPLMLDISSVKAVELQS